MRHLNRYNNFLIKESITDINLIKELIDDYFLEYIDSEEEAQSELVLDYWINPKEFDKENMSMSSSPSLGDVPCYLYELRLSKSISVDKVKVIQTRLNSDKQFKMIGFSVKSGYDLENSTLSEYTTIRLRLCYLLNKPVSEPDIVVKMKEPLEKLGYQIDEKEVGNWYLYKKYDEFDLDSNESEELFPMTSFYRRKIAGSHIPKDNKVEELKDQLLKLYDYDLDSEWNSLKKIIPNLPKPNFRKASSNEGLQVYLNSRVGKIEWYIYLQLNKKSQDVTELKVMSQVSYYDEIKNYSD